MALSKVVKMLEAGRFHNFDFWTRCPKDKKTLTSYNGFYAREERTYTNLVPQIEKMI